jgi:hypothetical protein
MVELTVDRGGSLRLPVCQVRAISWARLWRRAVPKVGVEQVEDADITREPDRIERRPAKSWRLQTTVTRRERVRR